MQSELTRRAYSVAEAAAMYSVSKSFLWQSIRAGRLPVRRVGRRVLILDADLVMFFEKRGERHRDE